MYYQLNYSRDAADWCGRKFLTVDEAIDDGTVAMLRYFEREGNQTAEIFGQDIQQYYGDAALQASFSVAEVDEATYEVRPIREINLKPYLKNTPGQAFKHSTFYLTGFIYDYAFKIGLSMVPEREWFYTIASLFPVIYKAKSLADFTDVFPQLYTALMMLAMHRKAVLDFDRIDQMSVSRPLDEIGSLAHALQYEEDISEAIMELIWILKVTAEEQWKVDINRILFDYVESLELAYEPLRA